MWQQCIVIKVPGTVLGQQFLDLLDQASGAMWAWPDLCGYTGVAWMSQTWCWGILLNSCMAGTTGACFIWLAGVAGAGDVGCMHGAGWGDAGCAAKKWCLACSVAGVPLGTVSTALILHHGGCPPCAMVCGTIADPY